MSSEWNGGKQNAGAFLARTKVKIPHIVRFTILEARKPSQFWWGWIRCILSVLGAKQKNWLKTVVQKKKKKSYSKVTKWVGREKGLSATALESSYRQRWFPVIICVFHKWAISVINQPGEGSGDSLVEKEKKKNYSRKKKGSINFLNPSSNRCIWRKKWQRLRNPGGQG